MSRDAKPPDIIAAALHSPQARYMRPMLLLGRRITMAQVAHVMGVTVAALRYYRRRLPLTATTRAMLLRLTMFCLSTPGQRVVVRAIQAAGELPPEKAIWTTSELVWGATPPLPDGAWPVFWQAIAAGVYPGRRPWVRQPDRAADIAGWETILPFWPDPAAARRSLVLADGTQLEDSACPATTASTGEKPPSTSPPWASPGPASATPSRRSR